MCVVIVESQILLQELTWRGIYEAYIPVSIVTDTTCIGGSGGGGGEGVGAPPGEILDPPLTWSLINRI